MGGLGGWRGEEGDVGKGTVRGEGEKVRWWGESRRRRKRRRGRDKWSKGETIGQKKVMMMNTLESFLAPARVSDWMACAHVRRCPNWQCWWDEDSVVAASGLTEDDERNLQADKMRSKARARKLAKSRSSFSPYLSLCAAGSKLLGL